jgi:CubicO group peptidase (beta-lactamase class C family)
MLFVGVVFLLAGCSQLSLTPDLNLEATLPDFEAQIEAGTFGNIHSLLVWQGDEMIWESYYDSRYDAEGLHYIYSVTKSVTSAAIGIALEQEYIDSLDTRLLSFFPEIEEVENDSAEKQAVTLFHVLTMTTGFAWDEVSTAYGSRENDATKIANSLDWTAYVLDRPMVYEPGEEFVYSSGNSMLLSGILENATGQTAEDFTAEHLFEPLGITDWRWHSGPKGITNTGWGLNLTPRDMMKIGRLYLQEGEWESVQIVPADWVKASTKAQVTGRGEYAYGYQWWRFVDDNPLVESLRKNDVFFAWGYGGQFIIVVPHLELVVVTTAENFDDATIIFEGIREFIFESRRN